MARTRDVVSSLQMKSYYSNESFLFPIIYESILLTILSCDAHLSASRPAVPSRTGANCSVKLPAASRTHNIKNILMKVFLTVDGVLSHTFLFHLSVSRSFALSSHISHPPTYVQTRVRTHKLAVTHVRTLTSKQTLVLKKIDIHTHTHTQKHALQEKQVHAYKFAHIHTYKRMETHARAHTHKPTGLSIVWTEKCQKTRYSAICCR